MAAAGRSKTQSQFIGERACQYQRREGSRLVGAVAHANETLRTIADRVTLNEGTDLHLVPGDACLLVLVPGLVRNKVSQTCTLCAGDSAETCMWS